MPSGYSILGLNCYLKFKLKFFMCHFVTYRYIYTGLITLLTLFLISLILLFINYAKIKIFLSPLISTLVSSCNYLVSNLSNIYRYYEFNFECRFASALPENEFTNSKLTYVRTDLKQ